MFSPSDNISEIVVDIGPLRTINVSFALGNIKLRKLGRKNMIAHIASLVKVSVFCKISSLLRSE